MFHRSLFAGSLSLGVLRFAKKIPNLSFTASAPRSFPDPKFWSVSWLEKNKKERKQRMVVVGFCCCSALGNFFFSTGFVHIRICPCPSVLNCRPEPSVV